MIRLASKTLPPLEKNAKLKAILRHIDEEGQFNDTDLNSIREAAGNIAKDEEAAIRMTIEAPDVLRAATPDVWDRFQNHLTLEARNRDVAWRRFLKVGFARGLSGAITGATAGITALPALEGVSQVTSIVVATLIGAYIGFRTGSTEEYGIDT